MASKLIAVVEDLFFLVRIQDAAKRAGCEIEFARSPDGVKPCALLIVDLSAAALLPLAAIEAAKALGVEVLAFVPHVDVQLKRRALEAGADRVVARSGFARHLAAALENLAAAR